MFILRDILTPLQNGFSSTRLGRQRSRWFVYTLLAFIVPYQFSVFEHPSLSEHPFRHSRESTPILWLYGVT
jgi:hypothetical protein